MPLIIITRARTEPSRGDVYNSHGPGQRILVTFFVTVKTKTCANVNTAEGEEATDIELTEEE